MSYFHPIFQAPYSSPGNCQEQIWAYLKREYYVRLHRREEDLADANQFRAMIQQLCDDVPINTDAILRANQRYLAHYLALGAEQ